MKKLSFKKRHYVVWAVLMLVLLSVAACDKNSPKVVSNLNTEANTTVESKEPVLTGTPPEVTAASGDGDGSPSSQAKEDGTVEENETAGAETAQEGAADYDRSAPKEEGSPDANKDDLYKGYNGPVQGEIKYQEGTPAAENSKQYKASGDIASPYQVDLIVTRDFGHSPMFGKTVGLVRDEVGMEVLFRNLDIITAYGGGFVNSINGLESGYTFFTGNERKKHDWFYWVNGILAPVGVAEYRPQPGDIIWWDYHDWSMTMFVPAVIGSYPQPFKNGFWGKNPGTVVMYSEGYQDAAQNLKQSLENQGVKQVDALAFDPQVLSSPRKYYILVGRWSQLAEKSDLLAKVNERNKMAGVYVKFEDDGLKGLDFKGKTVSSHSQAGAVFAYGSSIGSLNPVWVVTGTDDEGVKMALEVLINNPSAIREHFGAVFTKDGVINVPYIN